METQLILRLFCASSMLLLGACRQSSDVPKNQTEATSSTPQVVAPKAESPVTYDGPFGLKMGITQEQAKRLISDLDTDDENSNVATTTHVPISHPDFEAYQLLFSKKSGLCKIVAIGKDVQSGSTGAELRSAFDSIDEALTKKYGKGKLFDYTTEQFDAPNLWMMQLVDKNRTLEKFWGAEQGSQVSDDLSSIALEAIASDLTTGYLVMRYEFKNMDDCVDEENSSRNKGL